MSLASIVVPGAVFGLLAASNATAALEHAVAAQLATVARQAAQDVHGLLDEHRARVASWASQELMREILVGDVDKRISRFLVGERARDPMLLEAVATDRDGKTVAATDPSMIDTTARADIARDAVAAGGTPVVAGPNASARYARDVLEIFDVFHGFEGEFDRPAHAHL